MTYCPSCGEHGAPPYDGGRCLYCVMLEGAFACCEHSLQVPDRFSSADRLHAKVLAENNPVALGRMFQRAFKVCLEFGKTIPWDPETEQKAIHALARDIFLTSYLLDASQGKAVYDAITWPPGMAAPPPEKIIPFYRQEPEPEPDCDECKGTGWYTGLHDRLRCETCL